MNTALLHLLAKNWWVLLLRGILAIVFGIMAFTWPGLTLYTLVILYAAYAAADGVLSLAAAIRGGGFVPRWWLVLVGLIALAAAVAIFLYPGMSALILLIFVGWWAILRGIFEIVGAIQIRKEIDNEWWLVLGGLVSIAFGVFVLVRPGAGALAIIWLIAAYAIAAGLLYLAFAFRLKAHARKHA